ncbi:NADP-dependent glyceraldehyde-3-phosphate dehydrogenase, putative [Ricinus communis]|uniref:NADP-dependent glyceraldehyde-3-phosphate dehydrogenase n=1 Tax=Ricinus communis TaxID=3988 RepID=B9SMD7_RICCO|nr:NADP-dependent glyceraldehyde-3-phosphate dehydrogenase, putative [Ricinus communis]
MELAKESRAPSQGSCYPEREHKAPIAECLVKEIAKPAKDAFSEVVRFGDLISYTAEEGVRILGEGKFLVSDSFSGNERTKYCLTSEISLGVILAIPPFNYSVNLAVSKIGPALIAGNSLVLKPPTQRMHGKRASACSLENSSFFINYPINFPKGLISCVTGKGSEIGNFLIMYPGVNCTICILSAPNSYSFLLSFTGGDISIAISKKAGMIPLQMELGGKDACIVLEDADLDLVAANIIKGGFSYSGERCTAIKVVLVMDSVADALVEKVKARVAKLSVGLLEDNCDIIRVVTESINSIEEGIHHCNASNFGLQGCVFTRDINKAILISDAIETGTVRSTLRQLMDRIIFLSR